MPWKDLLTNVNVCGHAHCFLYFASPQTCFTLCIKDHKEHEQNMRECPKTILLWCMQVVRTFLPLLSRSFMGQCGRALRCRLLLVPRGGEQAMALIYWNNSFHFLNIYGSSNNALLIVHTSGRPIGALIFTEINCAPKERLRFSIS